MPYRWRWVGLMALLLAEAMNLLDATIVQVAAPSIHTELGGAVSDIQWFSAAYTLAFAVLLITGGRLGDVLGRRAVFGIGVGGFVLTSAACAIAPDPALLIAFRIAQGSAAALVIPQTFGLIRAMFEEDERARALGSIGPVMGLAAVSGPVLGGVLTHADLFGSSWRAVFLVNVPLGLIVLALAPLLMEDRAPHRPALDLTGTVLAMIGTGLLVYPLIESGPGHRPAWSWICLGAGVLVLIGFALQQRWRGRSGRESLVELSLFSGRAFPAALVTSTLFFAAMNGLLLVTVLHLQLGLGANSQQAGLALLPWSTGLAVASVLAGGYLVPRYGSRVLYAGLLVEAAGVLSAIATSHRDPGVYSGPLLGALALTGLGIGLFTAQFFTAALRSIDPRETGSAAGLLNAVQQLGGTLGVAILGSAYLDGATDPKALSQAFRVAVGLLLATAGAAVFMTARVRTPGQASSGEASSTSRCPVRRPTPLVPPAGHRGPPPDPSM